MGKTPKRIGFELFDDDLKTLINATAKIFPVSYTYIESGTNLNNYEYIRITDGVHKKEIYHYEDGVFSLIGAEDNEIDWVNDVINKPTEFNPSAHTHSDLHTHSNKTLLDTLNQTLLDLWNTVTGKADTVHSHDDLYYTETEINTLLSSKISNTDVTIALATKVDIVTGKALSTNDFTLDLKTKLESLSEAASIDYTTMNGNLEAHKVDALAHSNKADKSYVDTQLATKADGTTVSGHTGNATVHVDQTMKNTWNAKADLTRGTVQPATGYFFKVI